MGRDREHAAWLEACKQLNPIPKKFEPTLADRNALRNPSTLADHLSPTYVLRPHLTAIGEALEGFIDGTADRIALSCPPQTGKTFTAVDWGVFWWLCLHPSDPVIIISYNTNLALDRGTAIRGLILEYGARYGLYLERGSSSKQYFHLTSRGSVLSVGLGATLTGKRARYIVIDDPHKSRAEADSLVMRNKVHAAYGPDVLTRLAPGCPLLVVQTRWHVDDLVGRRIKAEGSQDKGGRWRVVHIPAICVNPDTDILGRKLGDPLMHPTLPEHDRAANLAFWEDVRRTQAPREWAALYQGDPRPAEGALLSWKLLESRRCFEQAEGDPREPCATDAQAIAVAVDPNGGGRDIAGIIGGYLGEDKRVYLTHDWSMHCSDPAAWARKACELAAEIDASKIIVETNFGARLATLAVRTAWEALRREQPNRFSVFCPLLVEVRARVGKVLRAEPIAQQFIEDKIRFAQYLPDTEAEFATWQAGSPESPGRIDATVYLAYELLPTPPSGAASITGMRQLASTDLTRGLTPGNMGMIG